MLKSFTVILMILAAKISCFAAQSSLQTFPRPVSAENVFNLEKSACAALESSLRICQGLTADDFGTAKFVVERNDELIGEWESEVFLGETADFQVFKGDLNSDGRDEIIVANRHAVSNGMGVNYWTIAVLPFPSGSEKLNPVQFQTEDFSVGATFIPRRKSGGFDILAANWQTLPIKKNSARTALYFVGRWLIYKNKELETSARPILIRRYLSAFERERLKNISDAKSRAYFWLNSPSAEKRSIDPLVDLPVKSETEGIIESVAAESANGKNRQSRSAYFLCLYRRARVSVTFN